MIYNFQFSKSTFYDSQTSCTTTPDQISHSLAGVDRIRFKAQLPSENMSETDVYSMEKEGTFVEDKGFDRSLVVKETGDGQKHKYMVHPHAPLRRNWGTDVYEYSVKFF